MIGDKIGIALSEFSLFIHSELKVGIGKTNDWLA